MAGHVAHLAEAAALELGVADGEHLVDDQDLGLEMRRHREGEAHAHARGVALDGGVEEARHAGEFHDLVEARGDLVLAQPEDRAVEIHVLASRELRVEAGPHLEQAADPPVDRGRARAWAP